MKNLILICMLFGMNLSADIVHLSDENFEISANTGVVVVDFYADWCGPCRSFGPIFEKVSNDYEGILFAKVNVDGAENVSAKYYIKYIPTIIVLVNGEEVARHVGGFTEKDFRNFISSPWTQN